MEKYFHVSSRHVLIGDLIQPGQFGRSIENVNCEIFHRNETRSALTFFYECLLEKSRLERFPDKPSRLECVFLWTSLHDAIWFRDTLKRGKPIYEVAPVASGNPTHFADIDRTSLLKDPDMKGARLAMARADEYWSHQPDTNARIEVLMPHPVRVAAAAG
jgi:hypothetical protein